MLSRGPAQGGPARAARGGRPDGQDDRQLPRGVHARAAHQRGRPHEHARHRHAAAAGLRRGDGRRGARAGRAARRARTRGASRRNRTSSRRRSRSWRPTRTSARARVLVVAGEGWHRGVIGIVASKLVDAFYRPAIVLSIEDERRARVVPQHPGVRHARARSSAARRCSIRFGGHRAGGRPDARGGARAGVPGGASTRCADEVLGPDDLRPRLRIDAPPGVPRPSPATGRRRSRHWRRSGPATRGRCSTATAWRSSTARGGSRTATSRWRCARRAACSARSPGGRSSARRACRSTGRGSTWRSRSSRTRINGETYVELTLADIRAVEDVGEGDRRSRSATAVSALHS